LRSEKGGKVIEGTSSKTAEREQGETTREEGRSGITKTRFEPKLETQSLGGFLFLGVNGVGGGGAVGRMRCEKGDDFLDVLGPVAERVKKSERGQKLGGKLAPSRTDLG